MSSSRITWVDYAKTICIYGMVCGHAGLKGTCLDVIYQFHMPAFFIISGMLFRPKGIGITLKSYAIPILFYGIFNLLYKLIISFYHAGFNIIAFAKGEGVMIILKWLRSFLFVTPGGSVFTGYWFVLTLLLMRMLMEIDWLRRKKFLMAIVCVVWCCIEPFLAIPQGGLYTFKPYHVISVYPFFVTGMLVKETHLDVMKGAFELKLIGLALFFILTLIQGRIDLASYRYGYTYAIVFINALLGSWLLFNCCNCLPQRQWITHLSTGTFLILGIHHIIYPIITLAYTHILGIHCQYLPLFVGIMVLAVCFPIIIYFEKKYPVLLGKVKN